MLRKPRAVSCPPQRLSSAAGPGTQGGTSSLIVSSIRRPCAGGVMKRGGYLPPWQPQADALAGGAALDSASPTDVGGTTPLHLAQPPWL